jgi:hypothetical protein
MVSIPPAASGYVTFDKSHQETGRVKDTNAMGKSSVGRAGVYEFRKSELLNAPQPLEWGRLDYPPNDILKLTGVEVDQIVKGVSDPLRFRIGRHLGRWRHGTTRFQRTLSPAPTLKCSLP